MRRTISIYWPFAIVVPLALAYLYNAGDTSPRSPLAIAAASRELARTMSYGLVDAAPQPLPAARRSATLGAAAKAL